MIGFQWVAIGAAFALLTLPSSSLADHHEASEAPVEQACEKAGEHKCGMATGCTCAKMGEHDCSEHAEHACGDAAECTCGKAGEHACGRSADHRCGEGAEKGSPPWGEDG
jgi:hypothetical protein